MLLNSGHYLHTVKTPHKLILHITIHIILWLLCTGLLKFSNSSWDQILLSLTYENKKNLYFTANSMRTPDHYTHMCFFLKLLPQNWKHKIVLNVFGCCAFKVSLHWNLNKFQHDNMLKASSSIKTWCVMVWMDTHKALIITLKNWSTNGLTNENLIKTLSRRLEVIVTTKKKQLNI